MPAKGIEEMLKRNLLLVGLTLLLSACGFQLRGTGETQFALKELDLQARDAYGEVAKQLTALLERSDVKVYQGAPYKLIIAREEEKQRTASYTSSARSAEYEISRTLHYQIRAGKDLVLLEDSVEVQQTYVHDQNNLIGSSQEGQQLRAEMTRELVQQLALRLQLLSPDRLAQLQETAEARARAEAEAAEAERRARAAVPQQSPIELPIPTK